MKLRRHLHIRTDLTQTVGCEITDLVVPVDGEAAIIACHGMVDREGTTTCAKIGWVLKLPAISQSQCVSESTFMQELVMVIYRNGSEPR